MDAILYAEIYFICILFSGVLIFWAGRSDTKSTAELWLKRLLVSFLLNFISNFLFTIFNRVWVVEPLVLPLSYALKTCYFITLVIGVFCWCGYAEAALGSGVFAKKDARWALYIPLALALGAPIVNLFTHWMFDFSEAYAYQRHFLFQGELAFLFVCSCVSGVRLMRRSCREGDPAQRGHLRLTATFPLCLLASLILSYAGEAVPVICVSVLVELQCIYMGATQHQISTDKLTQVNNRQNLIGFINHKLKNHAGDLFLLMIDLDEFKRINDTYGHLEGDRALVQLAGALKRVCGPHAGRPYIARYGGDEFIVVMEGEEGDVKRLCEDIHTALEEINASSSTYRLRASIGYAAYREGMDHKALIAAADGELYRVKHKKKR